MTFYPRRNSEVNIFRFIRKAKKIAAMSEYVEKRFEHNTRIIDKLRSEVAENIERDYYILSLHLHQKTEELAQHIQEQFRRLSDSLSFHIDLLYLSAFNISTQNEVDVNKFYTATMQI